MKPEAPDISWFLNVPALTTEAVELAHRDPEVGCLIDRVEPGRPLILSFGFLNDGALPVFDFFGRSKKLEDRFAIKFNRLLVRDLENAWYHRGVAGLGIHVDEVAAALQRFIQAIRPSRVMTIGQSMGGYAAIMFGMLLQADRIVAFGPTTYLDPAEAKCFGDRRYMQAIEALQADPPKSAYLDLTALGTALDHRGEIHLLFGTRPDTDDGASSHVDAIHALRLAQRANVFLYPYPAAAHAIVHWLVEQKEIDDVLAHLLVDLDDFCRPRSH